MLEWEDFEYEFTDKSKDWFWGLGIFAAFFFILAIILGNFLLGVIVVIGAIALVAYAVRPPEFLTYRLTEKGLVVKNRLYPYKQIESYWIHAEPWFHRLSLKSDRWFMPHILVPLVTWIQMKLETFSTMSSPKKNTKFPSSTSSPPTWGFRDCGRALFIWPQILWSQIFSRRHSKISRPRLAVLSADKTSLRPSQRKK